jgi:hypothetical protein
MDTLSIQLCNGKCLVCPDKLLKKNWAGVDTLARF